MSLVHCVPRRWVIPTSFEPRLVWNDSGTGGRPGSIWVVNEFGLMVATRGHGRPSGTFYKLKKDTFFVSPNDDRSDTARLTISAEGPQLENPGFEVTTTVESIWDDKGSGVSMEASVWRPVLPPGFVFFGDLMVRNHDEPTADVLICRYFNEIALQLHIMWRLICMQL